MPEQRDERMSERYEAAWSMDAPTVFCSYDPPFLLALSYMEGLEIGHDE